MFFSHDFSVPVEVIKDLLGTSSVHNLVLGSIQLRYGILDFQGIFSVVFSVSVFSSVTRVPPQIKLTATI